MAAMTRCVVDGCELAPNEHWVQDGVHHPHRPELVPVPRPPLCHHLKSWPVFFERVISGTKTYEIRRNDRDFRVGDVLYLQEWDPVHGQYRAGHAVLRAVRRCVPLDEIGIPGFVVMDLELPSAEQLEIPRDLPTDEAEVQARLAAEADGDARREEEERSRQAELDDIARGEYYGGPNMQGDANDAGD